MPLRRPLVLASTSPHRRGLLSRLGIPFEAEAPGVDEEAVNARGLPPPALVEALSRAKAEALAPRHPGALLVGSDQVVVLGERVLGKPGTRDGAVAQLMGLQGRSHELHTGVAVHEPATGRTMYDVAVHRLTMRPLGREAIRRYVERDLPLDCAGAYKIEGLGISLFSAVAGEDDTAIVGLPLIRLVTLLGHFGVDPLDP